MQFHEKKLIYLISRVFCLDFLKFSGPLHTIQNYVTFPPDNKRSSILFIHLISVMFLLCSTKTVNGIQGLRTSPEIHLLKNFNYFFLFQCWHYIENIDKMNNLDKRARMVRNHAYVMMKLRQEQRKVKICKVINNFPGKDSSSFPTN